MKKRFLTLAMALLLCAGLAAPVLAASDVSEGLTKVSAVGKDGQTLYGYTDQNGNAVIPIEYEELRDFYKGVVLGRKEGQYYLLNGKGTVLAALEYDGVGPFNPSGYAKVSKDYTYDEYLNLSMDSYNW